MMTLTSLPTLLTHRQLQNNIGETRILLQEAQTTSVTGRVTDLAEHMKGDIGRVHELEKLIADSDAYLVSLSSTAAEFRFAQQTLDAVRGVSQDMGVKLTGALNLEDWEAVSAYEIEAEGELEAIFGQLNLSYGGKNLFSGAAVDTAPLGSLSQMLTDVSTIITAGPDFATVNAALDTYFEDPAGGFQTTIYQGSTTAGPTREVAEGRRIGVEATPLDPGIRDTIRGLAVLATARAATPSAELENALLADSASTLNAAGNLLLEQQTRMGVDEEELALLTTRTEASKLTFETALIDLVGIDQFTAASELLNLETQLQAAYVTTGRVAALSLVNYL